MPTSLTSFDAAGCDVLAIPTNVEEIGGRGHTQPTPPFPPGQPFSTVFPAGSQIQTAAFGGNIPGSNPPVPNPFPCPEVIDNPNLANQRVAIINLNPVAYTAVWYVADPATLLGNVDGGVNTPGQVVPVPAFRIDAVGSNQPLLFESQAADGIFAPGELWQFIIQDYSNSIDLNPDPLVFQPIPPHWLDSLGLGFDSVSVFSSGSIIGFPVPEPGTGLLVLAGLVGIAARRKVRA